jgi:SAM-dependent methyltransferase
MSEINLILKRSGEFPMINNLIRNFLPKRKVVYDKSFFQEQWFLGWDELKLVLEKLIFEIGWKSVLDFGCGPGVMIDHMNTKGIRYVGCDYSEEAHKLYLSHYGRNQDCYVQKLEYLNLTSFEVILSFDVFEHMNDKQIIALLSATKLIPDIFVNISRDWRTPGHINIKSDRSWIKFFRNQGIHLNLEKTNKVRDLYISIRPGCPDIWQKNMFVFSRKKD